MPNINLSILNQKATPAFFADTLANRPAPSFVGRIFISTDTLDLYRDTGSAWLLLSPSSTGTITGSGAAGQVTYFSGTSSITGSNNLFWDNVNGHLGIKTITPDCALDVNHDGIFVAKFNNTAAGSTLIGLFDQDNPQWLFGTENVNDSLKFYDATNFPTILERVTFKADGQTFIGTETTSSGRLVVNNATGDNHIVVIGATAPSIRINNAGSGATRQIGIGLATTTNNFIQGTTGGEMAIFNSNTTASPILFGIYDAGLGNTQEAARISAARNFIVGSSVDAGYKFDVNGSGRISGNTIFSTDSATKVGIGTTTLTRGTRAVIKGSFTSFNGTGNGQLAVISDDNGVNPAAADVGATIVLGGSISASDTDRTFVALGGYKENSIDGNRAGYFVIGTRQGTSPNDIFERIRVTSTGLTLFNTTTTQATAGGIDISSGGLSFISGADNNTTTRTDSTIKLTRFGVVHYTNSEAPVCVLNANSQSTQNELSIGGGAGAMNSMQIIRFWIGATNTTKSGTEVARFENSNLLIGTTTDTGQKLQVNGTTYLNGNVQIGNDTNPFLNIANSGGLNVKSGIQWLFGGSQSDYGGIEMSSNASDSSYMIFKTRNSGTVAERMRIKQNGVINLTSIPTSSSGLSSGDIWSNSGVLTIVP